MTFVSDSILQNASLPSSARSSFQIQSTDSSASIQ